MALKRIWFATDQMCSKKLKAAILLWLPHYEQEYGVLSVFARTQLLAISARSIDRLLQPVRAQSARHGLCGTKPGTLLKNQICIRTEHWDVTQPGFVEADTVAHCGNSLAGDFVWSLTMTDILSGWTENRATWNKGALGVTAQIKDIESMLPFPCSALIAIMVPNSSITICTSIWPTGLPPLNSPAPAPTAKTIALTSNKKTGRTCASSSAMTASINRICIWLI